MKKRPVQLLGPDGAERAGSRDHFAIRCRNTFDGIRQAHEVLRYNFGGIKIRQRAHSDKTTEPRPAHGGVERATAKLAVVVSPW
jgi:hypothetical protein